MRTTLDIDDDVLEAARAIARLSLVASDLIGVEQIATPGQVTDAYLLALAAANGGKLATFDRRLSTKAVRRGRHALHVIGTK